MIKLTAVLTARCSGFGPVVTIPAVAEWASELGLPLPRRLADSPGSSRCFPALARDKRCSETIP